MVANQNLTQVFEKLVLPVRINFEKIVQRRIYEVANGKRGFFSLPHVLPMNVTSEERKNLPKKLLASGNQRNKQIDMKLGKIL